MLRLSEAPADPVLPLSGSDGDEVDANDARRGVAMLASAALTARGRQGHATRVHDAGRSETVGCVRACARERERERVRTSERARSGAKISEQRE